MSDVDADRVARLAAQILRPIADNLAASTVRYQAASQLAPVPQVQWEVLHALAFAAASVVVNAGDYHARLEARSFLARTVEDMIGELLRNPPRPPLLPSWPARR